MLRAGLVEDDPVVALPVDDRRERQLVQPALRRTDRASLETECLRRPCDPVQGGPAYARVRDVADVRQRDRAAVGTADHREARRTAVHLVELEDMREATPSLPPRLLGGSIELLDVLRHAGC